MDRRRLKSWAVVVGVSFLLGTVLGYCGPRLYEEKTRPLPGSPTAMHDVASAPVKGQDKGQLRERGAITKKVAEDRSAEVLSTGKVSDDSGSRTVAAVLNTKDGLTTFVEKRPFAEWMSRNEVGLGYGWGDAGEIKAIRYEHTFARVWELYASAEARVEATTDDTRWSAVLWMNYRW